MVFETTLNVQCAGTHCTIYRYHSYRKNHRNALNMKVALHPRDESTSSEQGMKKECASMALRWCVGVSSHVAPRST